MAKASDIAASLHGIAASFEALGDLEAGPVYMLIGSRAKEQFASLITTLPTPRIEEVGHQGTKYEDLNLIHKGEAVHMTVSVPMSVIGVLVEPAKPAKYSYPSINGISAVSEVA